MKDVRLRWGVSPVDENAAEGSGPGSVKRTRFLGLVGVLGGSREHPSASTLGSDFGTSTASGSLVLIRRFRRTARGLSSVMSTTSIWEVCIAIARQLLGIDCEDGGRKEKREKQHRYERKDRVLSECQQQEQV